MDDTLLTIAEVAELLKLNPETVPNWLWYPRLRLTLQHLDRICALPGAGLCTAWLERGACGRAAFDRAIRSGR